MKERLTYKDVKFEFKDIGDKGKFEGYASAFGNVDLGGDIVLPGAFTKTISEKQSRPLLWSHDLHQPIGVTQLAEDTKGLAVNGQLNLDVERGREVHSLVKQGAVTGMSIGYFPVTKNYRNGVRELREVKLFEISLVAVPMNPDALVTDIKSSDDLQEMLQLVLAYQSDEPLSPEIKGLMERLQTKFSALQAAQAPEAATQDDLAPGILHATSDRILKMLT